MIIFIIHFHHYIHEVLHVEGEIYQTRDFFDPTQPILTNTLNTITYRLGLWYLPTYPVAITRAHIASLRVIFDNRLLANTDQYSLELLPTPTTSVVQCIHLHRTLV